MSFAACLVVGHVHQVPPAGTTLSYGTASSTRLSFPWAHQLAREFPGCAKAVPAGTVPTSFVVERESGALQELPFMQVWRWTHHAGGVQVWVRGRCA